MKPTEVQGIPILQNAQLMSNFIKMKSSPEKLQVSVAGRVIYTTTLNRKCIPWELAQEGAKGLEGRTGMNWIEDDIKMDEIICAYQVIHSLSDLFSLMLEDFSPFRHGYNS